MLKFFFSFNGRARRLHWWLGRFGVIAIAILVLFAEMAFSYFVFPETRSGEGGYGNTNPIMANVFVASVFALLFLITWSEIALTVRRFHDRAKSGFWYFIILIPIIGPFWVLIECGFLDGTQGPNEHGPSPKGIGFDDTARVFA
jgi:uncharacterized membrane protein YhaH (DUF805 family)